MKLTIALATRGRPELLRKTIDRTICGMRRTDTRLVVLADHDDLSMASFAVPDERVIVSNRAREDTIGEKYNRAIKIAPADVYMTMTDYGAQITPGFDAKILEAAKLFPDGIGVIYNHMANPVFPLLNAATATWVELTDGIYPGWFPYWFVDHWLDDLARMTDRFVCADVQTDISTRPGTQDQREPGFWGIFFDVLAADRRKIACRIIDALDEPFWRKKILCSRLHLIEERSQMINAAIRDLEGTDKTRDERYLRIKGRAMAKLRELQLELAA